MVAKKMHHSSHGGSMCYWPSMFESVHWRLGFRRDAGEQSLLLAGPHCKGEVVPHRYIDR